MQTTKLNPLTASAAEITKYGKANFKFNKHDFEVKQSNIPGARFGLFTNSKICKGDLIDQYVGEFINRGDPESRAKLSNYEHDRLFTYDWIVDDELSKITVLGDDTKCWCVYINDTIDFREYTLNDYKDMMASFSAYLRHSGPDGKPLEYNCTFEPISEDIVAIRATKDIEPGEELYINYSVAYWIYRMIEAGFFDHD